MFAGPLVLRLDGASLLMAKTLAPTPTFMAQFIGEAMSSKMRSYVIRNSSDLVDVTPFLSRAALANELVATTCTLTKVRGRALTDADNGVLPTADSIGQIFVVRPSSTPCDTHRGTDFRLALKQQLLEMIIHCKVAFKNAPSTLADADKVTLISLVSFPRKYISGNSKNATCKNRNAKA